MKCGLVLSHQKTKSMSETCIEGANLGSTKTVYFIVQRRSKPAFLSLYAKPNVHSVYVQMLNFHFSNFCLSKNPDQNNPENMRIYPKVLCSAEAVSVSSHFSVVQHNSRVEFCNHTFMLWVFPEMRIWLQLCSCNKRKAAMRHLTSSQLTPIKG